VATGVGMGSAVSESDREREPQPRAEAVRNWSASNAQTPWTTNPAVAPQRPCTCRYFGKDIRVGQSICMKTPSGYVEARCGRTANNTSWQITDKACDLTS